jgi:hypothetical protein
MGVGYQGKAESPGLFLPATVPLIGVQVAVVVIIFIGLNKARKWFVQRFPKSSSLFQKEVFNITILWAVTFLLWISVPVEPNYFIDTPRPPNYEFYLMSDSLDYEIGATSLLAGKGFSNIVYHPMYVLFYGLLHILAGGQYIKLVNLQVAVLSVVPVMIYLITKTMQNRQIGFFVAGLVILRERNKLLLMENVSGPNVKMIMTEMLTVLCLLISIYLVMKWFHDRRITYLILAGGFLGISWLIRVELLTLTPVYLMGLTVFSTNDRRKWIKRILLFIMGVAIVISPWMYRNWQRTGVVYIDKYQKIRNMFRDLPEWFNFQPEGLRSDPKYALEIVHTSVSDGSIKNQSPVPVWDPVMNYVDYFPADRGFQVPGFLDHFANDFMQLFFILPSGHHTMLILDGLVDYDPSGGGVSLSKHGFFSDIYLWKHVRGLPYYWTEWQGEYTVRSIFPVLLSVILVSVGIRTLWDEEPFSVLLLILSLLFYILGYSIYGSSGGRYIQVVDWIPIVFYGVGLIRIIPDRLCCGQVENEQEKREGSEKQPSSLNGKGTIMLVVFVIAFIGLALPLSELVFPDQYTEQILRSKVKSLIRESQEPDSSFGNQMGEETFSSDVIAYGETVFPRYYLAGERMEDDRFGTIPDYTYSRIEFYLVGTEKTWVNIPLEKPVDLPDGSEVIVIGSFQEKKKENNVRISGRYLKASHVIILESKEISGEPLLIKSEGEDR